MAIETRRYDLYKVEPDGGRVLHRRLELRLFPNEEYLRAHLWHFGNPNEHWRAAVKDLAEATTGFPPIENNAEGLFKKECQELASSIVLRVYELVCPVLDKGIRWAAERPLYAEFDERQVATGTQPKLKRKFVMLTNYGFLVAGAETCVLSAYYKSAGPETTPETCFNHAWELQNRRLRGRQAYKDDNKGTEKIVTWVECDEWGKQPPEWDEVAPPELPRIPRKGTLGAFYPEVFKKLRQRAEELGDGA